jgi:hypothetical protein
MAEDQNSRIERLENLMAVLADKQARLDEVLVLLTESQIKTHEDILELKQSISKTDEHLRRVEAEGRERARYFDDRVDKLVIAMGEFIRRRDAGLQ